jgi:hypothetical protein
VGAIVVSLAGVVAVVVSVEVLVVDDVEDSLPLSLPPHAAVSVLNAITAATPAVTEKRRVVRVWVMSLPSVSRAVLKRSTRSQEGSSMIRALKFSE